MGRAHPSGRPSRPAARRAMLDGLEKIGKKRQLDPTLTVLDEVSAVLSEWQQDEAEGMDGRARAKALEALRGKLVALDVCAAHHKEYASAVTKLGKVLDKQIGPSVEGAVPVGPSEPSLVNVAIHQHLLVTGRFEAAERLTSVCAYESASELEAALREMHAVRTALARCDTCPLINWISTHQGMLPQGSHTVPSRRHLTQCPAAGTQGSHSAQPPAASNAQCPLTLWPACPRHPVPSPH